MRIYNFRPEYISGISECWFRGYQKSHYKGSWALYDECICGTNGWELSIGWRRNQFISYNNNDRPLEKV